MVNKFQQLILIQLLIVFFQYLKMKMKKMNL